MPPVILSPTRKRYIREFKERAARGSSLQYGFPGSEKWMQKLLYHVNSLDEAVEEHHVRFWVKNHKWITMPPNALAHSEISTTNTRRRSIRNKLRQPPPCPTSKPVTPNNALGKVGDTPRRNSEPALVPTELFQRNDVSLAIEIPAARHAITHVTAKSMPKFNVRFAPNRNFRAHATTGMKTAAQWSDTDSDEDEDDAITTRRRKKFVASIVEAVTDAHPYEMKQSFEFYDDPDRTDIRIVDIYSESDCESSQDEAFLDGGCANYLNDELLDTVDEYISSGESNVDFDSILSSGDDDSIVSIEQIAQPSNPNRSVTPLNPEMKSEEPLCGFTPVGNRAVWRRTRRWAKLSERQLPYSRTRRRAQNKQEALLKALNRCNEMSQDFGSNLFRNLRDPCMHQLVFVAGHCLKELCDLLSPEPDDLGDSYIEEIDLTAD